VRFKRRKYCSMECVYLARTHDFETKACERGGCTGALVGRGKELARRRFCSSRCQYLDRVWHGWQQPTITPEMRTKAGQIGGRTSAKQRHKRLMKVIANDLVGRIPAHLREGLTRRQEAYLRALMARAWRLGYRRGQHSKWITKQREKLLQRTLTKRVGEAYGGQESNSVDGRHLEPHDGLHEGEPRVREVLHRADAGVPDRRSEVREGRDRHPLAS
jgi:hypothetical protein